ncbi:17532_t:CDS:2, partial [Gigaspora rosea]
GLNDRYKCQQTITLLKTYKIESVMIQKTNLANDNTKNFLKQQWGYDSVWMSKVAILAGNRDIKFENVKESHQGRVLCAEFQYRKRSFRAVNVYAPSALEERVRFLDGWSINKNTNAVNIVAGGFNVNLDPEVNRISHVTLNNDLSKRKLKELTRGLVDMIVAASQTPFLTYFQRTKEGNNMATSNRDEFYKSKLQTSYWKDYCKCKLQSLVRARRFLKVPESSIQKLNKKINVLEEKIARNKDLSDLQLVIESLKRNLQDELTDLAKKWQIRSNARWIKCGEKSMKYFFSRFKIRHNAAAIDKIKIPDNIEGSSSIEEDDNQNLVKYITKEEIIEVIRSLSNNKALGTDGITYEFYKELAEESGLVFEKIFNDENEDLEDVRNWRPISLTNCDVKIFMKILANRLNIICQKIIGIYQQGFIKGRLILESVMDIMSILRNQSDQMQQGWLLFLDQQKAFDRVNYEYLQGVLTKMKFNPSFIQIIMALFSEQTAYIADSGIMSEPFKVNRGVRQGDPLSPLLYVLAFESFLRSLNKNLMGIAISQHSRQQRFKLMAYADDLTVGIASQAEWDVITKMIQEYENASNVKINKIKSALVPLTSNARRIEHHEAKEFKMLSENESVKALGFELDSKGRISKNTWAKIILKIKNMVEKLSQRSL